MSKKADTQPVTTQCAVVVITGIMLLLSSHHGTNAAGTNPWTHAAIDVVAVMLITCPFIRALFRSVVTSKN